MVRMRTVVGAFGKLALSALLAAALFPCAALAGAPDVEADAGAQVVATAEESAGDDETIPSLSDSEGSDELSSEASTSKGDVSEEDEASATEQQGAVAALMEEDAPVAQAGEGVLASSGYDEEGNLVADALRNKWELKDSRTLVFYSLQTATFSNTSAAAWVTAIKDNLSPGAITVEFAEGITELPNYTFLNLSGLAYPLDLVVPSTLTKVSPANLVGTLSATNCIVLNSLVSHGSPCCQGGVLYADGTHADLIASSQHNGAVTIPASVTKIESYAFLSDEAGFTTLAIDTVSLTAPKTKTAAAKVFAFLRDPNTPYNGYWDAITAAVHPIPKGEKGSFWVEDDENSANYGAYLCQATASSTQVLFTAKLPWVIEGGVRYNETQTIALGVASGFSGGSVVLADTCVSIADAAFQNVGTLTSISGVAVTSIGSRAFSGCTALASASFPAAKTIGTYAFADCGKLSSIDIDNAESIAQYALSGCALDSFVVPATVSSIGDSAFSSTVLKTLDMSQCKGITTLSPIGACSALTNLMLPPALESVSAYAFANCTALRAVDLSAVKMTTLPAGIFVNCTALAEVAFPATMTSFAATTITDTGAFQGCTSLRSIDLSAMRMASIPANSFNGCTSLTDVKWPQGLVSLGQSSFQGTGFQAVELPTGFTMLGGSAFADCGNLTKVTLPPTVATIGANAFQNCKKLLKIDIPFSVTSIGSLAFAGTGMTSFKFGANLYAGTTQSSWSQDGDSYGGAQLFCATTPVAIGRLLNGVATDQTDWSQISELDLSECSLDYLPPYMFAGLNKLTEVTLPHNIASVDVGAFFGCTALEDVYVYNQNIRLAGAGTATDSGLGWVSVSYPAFSHWEYQGTNPDPSQDHAGWKFVSTTGMRLHGLAYASNDLIAYAENNDCTFVPFVVLDDYDTKSAFGYDVYGYNEVQGVPESLEFTGEDLMGQIAPKVCFTDPGVPDGYDIDLAADKSRLTYQVCDASGNVVSSVVDPGTYTVKVAGVAGSRDVFGTKTLTVNVAYTPSSVQVTGDVASAGAALAMDAATGDALAALGSPTTAAGLKAALDAATHVVDVSHVSSGTAYDEVVASVGSGTLGMAFDVSYYINDVQVHDGFGRLTVTVGVPEAARGHWVTLHHRHQDGSITTQNLKCTGSTLSFTVTDLSTFALEIGALINPSVAQGATTTVYRTVYQPGAAAPLAATGAELVAPDNAVQAKGAAPDIAYGGNATGGGEAQLDWLPLLIAGLLVLLAAGAVTWFLLARKRSKDEEQGQAVA